MGGYADVEAAYWGFCSEPCCIFTQIFGRFFPFLAFLAGFTVSGTGALLVIAPRVGSARLEGLLASSRVAQTVGYSLTSYDILELRSIESWSSPLKFLGYNPRLISCIDKLLKSSGISSTLASRALLTKTWLSSDENELELLCYCL